MITSEFIEPGPRPISFRGLHHPIVDAPVPSCGCGWRGESSPNQPDIEVWLRHLCVTEVTLGG